MRLFDRIKQYWLKLEGYWLLLLNEDYYKCMTCKEVKYWRSFIAGEYNCIDCSNAALDKKRLGETETWKK